MQLLNSRRPLRLLSPGCCSYPSLHGLRERRENPASSKRYLKLSWSLIAVPRFLCRSDPALGQDLVCATSLCAYIWSFFLRDIVIVRRSAYGRAYQLSLDVGRVQAQSPAAAASTVSTSQEARSVRSNSPSSSHQHAPTSPTPCHRHFPRLHRLWGPMPTDINAGLTLWAMVTVVASPHRCLWTKGVIGTVDFYLD